MDVHDFFTLFLFELFYYSSSRVNFNTINEAAYASESDLAYNLLDYLKDEYKLKKQSIEYRAIDIVDTIRKSIKTDSPINKKIIRLSTLPNFIIIFLSTKLIS